MPSSSVHRDHRDHIPGELISTWQSLRCDNPTARAPRVRRPATACLSCRGAKVKCSGQQECARCVSRGLRCVYSRHTAAAAVKPPHRPLSHLRTVSPAEVGAWPSTIPTIAVDRASETPANADPSSPDDRPQPGLAPLAPHASPSVSMPAIGSLAPSDCAIDLNGLAWAKPWTPTDPVSANPIFGSLDPSSLRDWETPASLDYGPPHLSLLNDNFDSIFHNGGPFSALDDVLPDLTHSDSSGEQSVDSPPECRCRVNIMLFPPRATRAMRGKRLDTIFNVTREMMKGCQDLMDCESCDVGCADLLLMMTILQETSGCFLYIAKSNLDSAVKVSFGDYEITSENAQFRSVLITDLVQRATAVLASISAKCRSKIEEVDDAQCDLARANITYLETTIDHFKSVLRCVTDYVATSPVGSGSAITHLMNGQQS
ncbi:hypothetical protein F5Y14DRAFT_280982 [Nemania sp. NC0429]|nr:hypothetical protein F5Y14DRAFT_280982 [Nemania sp. NC0429]